MQISNTPSDKEFIKCRKCGNEYYRTWSRCPNCHTKTKRSLGKVFFMLVLVTGIALFAYEDTRTIIKSKADEIYSNFNGSKEDLHTVSADNDLIFTEEPIEFPKTGVYEKFTDKDCIAPFTFRTGTSKGYKLVKLTDIETQSPVITIFINEGDTAEVKVPLGEYKIIIAAGYDWYGDEYLFGPGTSYIELDNTYPFLQDFFGSISTWTIDMTPTYNGNLNFDYKTKENW